MPGDTAKRTEQLWQESWNAVQDAKRAVSTFTDAEGKEHKRGRDFSVLAPIINAAARSLELFGRGAGYLRDDAGGTHIENMMVVLPRRSGEADPETPVGGAGPVLEGETEK